MGHLNFRGAEKATHWIGRHLVEKYGLDSSVLTESELEKWAHDVMEYDQLKKSGVNNDGE